MARIASLALHCRVRLFQFISTEFTAIQSKERLMPCLVVVLSGFDRKVRTKVGHSKFCLKQG